MSTIYVNAEWNADSVLSEGLVWGENAFASFVEAMETAVQAGSSEIKILGNVSEVLPTDQEFVVNN
ncbi:MAG: hypothetical protein IKB71_05650, partial [Lentisphaeria bacterium]|nr:hypothetical protein [Lentisphaeria bacterium]